MSSAEHLVEFLAEQKAQVLLAGVTFDGKGIHIDTMRWDAPQLPPVPVTEPCAECGCPTYGQHEKAKTGAERQREWRERQKNE